MVRNQISILVQLGGLDLDLADALDGQLDTVAGFDVVGGNLKSDEVQPDLTPLLDQAPDPEGLSNAERRPSAARYDLAFVR